MSIEERVFIAGAGPVGLSAAAALVRRGVPVTVFETAPTLSAESRASTFHPSTLDMLDELGAAKPLVALGLIAPRFQYRSRRRGVFGEFDFKTIADVTRHPFRLQVEQSKLTRILLDRLRDDPNFRIEFSHEVEGVTQSGDSVTVRLAGEHGTQERTGRWLIGADGARSAVRHALGVEFEGFTWPERFLVISTPFDFPGIIPDLASVSYFTDLDGWYFLLQIPGLWRAMFPIAAEVSDDTATDHAYAQSLLATIVPGRSGYEIAHTTLYRVHQRVARSFRTGRAFLAGDAAHINNPLGGMGMNGGIHDVLNLAERLAQVWHGEAPAEALDRYDLQRRGVTLEYVQKQTIQNKRNLEPVDEADHARFRDEMQRTAADPALAHAYLVRVSMIASLKRAAELG